VIVMTVNLIHGMLYGEKAGDNPWGGATLEWTISSPPPGENFLTEPVLSRGPYDYKDMKPSHAD